MLDFIVVIGRFQPLHLGHIALIEDAAKRAKHVLVGIGSAGEARTFKNPFTYEERKAFVEDEFPVAEIQCFPVYDHLDNGVWASQVNASVHEIIMDTVPWNMNGGPVVVGLGGYRKDSSSFYLDMFPSYEDATMEQSLVTVDATDIRKQWYYGWSLTNQLLTEFVKDYLNAYRSRMLGNSICPYTVFRNLVDEYIHSVDYPEEQRKYPITNVCADSVCIYKGEYVLLIQRKEVPGRGLWALPGGHMNPDETLEACAYRELEEETSFNPIGEPFFREMYDAPNRALHARVISEAFAINVTDEEFTFQLKADDDAAKASWWHIDELTADMIFQDHLFIIEDAQEAWLDEFGED